MSPRFSDLQDPEDGHWRPFAYARQHLNFFRVHVLAFTFTPLIFSAIFYASNGDYHISYIDALFNCVSAMTVCGLATVDLSSLTGWQQGILFMQMCFGSPVLVSWIIVYVRRHFFAKKFEHALRERLEREERNAEARATGRPLTAWTSRLSTAFRTPTRQVNDGTDAVELASPGEESVRKRKSRPASIMKKLRPDMIRRTDAAPRLVNPSGWVNDDSRRPGTPPPTPYSPQSAASLVPMLDKELVGSPAPLDVPSLPAIPEAARPSVAVNPVKVDELSDRRKHSRRQSDPGYAAWSSSAIRPEPLALHKTLHAEELRPIPRTHTIEFAILDPPHRHVMEPKSPARPRFESDHGLMSPAAPGDSDLRRTVTADRQSRATSTRRPGSQYATGPPPRTKHRGYGGFPLPHVLAGRLLVRLFPQIGRALTRTVTVPVGVPGGADGGLGRYVSFTTLVGRNSAFPGLTNDQLEELGGVEYRALNALLWIVAAYHILSQLICFIIIAPYMAQGKWKSDFQPPALHKPVSSPWYSMFQVVSAYTNTGMSLVDTSLVPFQRAYTLLFPLIFLVLAGNTAFPVFLRFTIWVISKSTPRSSRLSETLHFLLDHPRRCFLYLFPSHQTWFLLTVLVVLNATDWFFFLVLDIGNPAIENIPIGTRFAIGLLQATAVRAAGFGTVSLSALAPAVRVLYTLMMYVSVYPIAMSVRSTNVYEEQSLGIFTDKEDKDDDDDFHPTGGHRMTVWSSYLAMHARRQLSFDMWWLGMALFLVCIIERDALDNPANSSWFTIFNILFELVSAYGSVGLSLGIPFANYSFSGAFRPLSKLIVCAVMLRGRHRGLPVAIDRAVMLPAEFRATPADAEEQADGEGVPRTRTRHSTAGFDGGVPLGVSRTRTRHSVANGGLEHREKAEV